MATTTVKLVVPQPINTNTTIHGLNNIGITETLNVPLPIVTNATQTLVLPQPFKTESDITTTSTATTNSTVTSNSDAKQALSVDLKPVSMDLCLNTSSKLPQGCIHQPFNVHLGFTLFGLEVFGMNFGGESRLTLTDLPKRPVVDWPAQQNSAPPPAYASPKPASHGGPSMHEHGLRVRIR